MLNSSAQLGTAIGLAVLTPLAATPDRYHLGFLGAGLVALAAMCVGWLLPTRVPQVSGEPLDRVGQRSSR